MPCVINLPFKTTPPWQGTYDLARFASPTIFRRDYTVQKYFILVNKFQTWGPRQNSKGVLNQLIDQVPP